MAKPYMSSESEAASKRSSRPLSVAIVTSIHTDFDGRLWKYAQSLRNRGIDTYMVSPWKVSTPEFEGIHFRSFRRAETRAQRLKLPFRILRAILPIWRSVDLIHFHDIDLLPLMTLISLLKPVVYDCHENYPDEILIRPWVPSYLRVPLSHAVRLGQWICSTIIGNVVLVAPSQEHDFPLSRLRWTYVKNYAQASMIDGCSEDYDQRSNTVIFTGSQHPGNGSLVLLDVVMLALRQVPDLRVICFDKFQTQEFRAEFLRQVKAKHLEDAIEMVPQCLPHELPRYLNRCRVAISPNLRTTAQINGIHTKLFEYMAAGLPLVVSNLPHQVGLVTEANCGLLAVPEDPSTFADAIVRLLRDPGLALSLGRNGRTHFISHCSWESQEPTIMKFYGSILGRQIRISDPEIG